MFALKADGGSLPTLSADGLRLVGTLPFYEEGTALLLALPLPSEERVRWSREKILKIISLAPADGLELNVEAVMSSEQRSTLVGKRLYRAYMAVEKAISRGRPYFSAWDEALKQGGFDPTKIRKSDIPVFGTLKKSLKPFKSGRAQI